VHGTSPYLLFRCRLVRCSYTTASRSDLPFSRSSFSERFAACPFVGRFQACFFDCQKIEPLTFCASLMTLSFLPSPSFSSIYLLNLILRGPGAVTLSDLHSSLLVNFPFPPFYAALPFYNGIELLWVFRPWSTPGPSDLMFQDGSSAPGKPPKTPLRFFGLFTASAFFKQRSSTLFSLPEPCTCFLSRWG